MPTAEAVYRYREDYASRGSSNEGLVPSERHRSCCVKGGQRIERVDSLVQWPEGIEESNVEEVSLSAASYFPNIRSRAVKALLWLYNGITGDFGLVLSQKIHLPVVASVPSGAVSAVKERVTIGVQRVTAKCVLGIVYQDQTTGLSSDTGATGRISGASTCVFSPGHGAQCKHSLKPGSAIDARNACLLQSPVRISSCNAL